MSKGIDLKRIGFGCAHRYTENNTYRYININITIRAYVYKKASQIPQSTGKAERFAC